MRTLVWFCCMAALLAAFLTGLVVGGRAMHEVGYKQAMADAEKVADADDPKTVIRTIMGEVIDTAKLPKIDHPPDGYKEPGYWNQNGRVWGSNGNGGVWIVNP